MPVVSAQYPSSSIPPAPTKYYPKSQIAEPQLFVELEEAVRYSLNQRREFGIKNSDADVNTYLDEQAGPWFRGLPVLETNSLRFFSTSKARIQS